MTVLSVLLNRFREYHRFTAVQVIFRAPEGNRRWDALSVAGRSYVPPPGAGGDLGLGEGPDQAHRRLPVGCDGLAVRTHRWR
jgi:hypothetical protein